MDSTRKRETTQRRRLPPVTVHKPMLRPSSGLNRAPRVVARAVTAVKNMRPKTTPHARQKTPDLSTALANIARRVANDPLAVAMIIVSVALFLYLDIKPNEDSFKAWLTKQNNTFTLWCANNTDTAIGMITLIPAFHCSNIRVRNVLVLTTVAYFLLAVKSTPNKYALSTFLTFLAFNMPQMTHRLIAVAVAIAAYYFKVVPVLKTG
jgi:hypothetical protein